MSKTKILACTEATYLSSGYAKYYNALLNYLHSTGEFEICELASWGDNADPRSHTIPWKFVGNLPFGATFNQADPKEIQAYESNPYNKFGAFKFEKTVLDFKPDHVCVPPDSLVFTSDGYKEIQNVKVGDQVLTHLGRFKRVISTMKRQYSGNIRKIFTYGNESPLVCTENHPVYNFKYTKRSHNKRNNSSVYSCQQPVFTEADKIKIGDLTCFPILTQNNQIYHTINVYDYLDNGYVENNEVSTSLRSNKINNTIKIDKNFGRLIGYIIGDGYIGPHSVNITFHGDEDRFAKDAIKLFKDIFNIDSKIRSCVPDGKNCITVSANSIVLKEFLSKFIVHHDIPKVFWMSPDDVKEGLICGLTRADGCYKKNTVSFASIDKKLAYNYKQLCVQLGIPVNITKTKKKTETNNLNDYYEVNGYGSSATTLHTIVDKYTPDLLTPYANSKRPNRKTQIIKHCMTTAVRINRIDKYKGTVYNLEVEDDNSYVVDNFCVHNCDVRDIWHSQHAISSPLRPYYNLILMPAIDAEPQKDEWVSHYKSADAIITYTDWAKDILNKISGSTIKTTVSASPVCDTCFTPVLDKAKHKQMMGFSPEMKVIGTVMRNQRRKLFPALIETFERYIIDNNINDTYLYCHTSYPDDGFDFPSLIKSSKIGHKMIFTYVCRKCGNVSPGFFKDAKTVCTRCNHLAMGMPNTTVSVSNEVLSQIYNSFDIYVQYASLEGFGMPVVEAAACGVPVMATDYSAMSEVVRKLSGIPLKVKYFNTEMESGRRWAYPDNDYFIDKLKEFFNASESNIRALSAITRQRFEQHYNNWGTVGRKWYDVIKLLPNKNLWDAPPNINYPPAFDEKPYISNTDYAKWLICDVLGRPEFMGTNMELRLIRDLNFNATNYGMGGMYYNEESCEVINSKIEDFDRSKAYHHMLGLCEHKNTLERLRTQ